MQGDTFGGLEYQRTASQSVLYSACIRANIFKISVSSCSFVVLFSTFVSLLEGREFPRESRSAGEISVRHTGLWP